MLIVNFRRKIADFVEDTGELTSDKGHRPAKHLGKKLNKFWKEQVYE